jgi:Uma2 family endonuclease
MEIISQYELERGKPAPRIKHSVVQGNLIGELLNYRDRYRVLPEVDVQLNGKIFVPDIALYPKQPVNWMSEEDPLHEAPLLAVEIISQSQTLEQLFAKADVYLNAGTTSVWVIVPAVQTVYVVKLNSKPEPYTTGILRDDPLGIEVQVDNLFA